jgi:hypothetical protein
MSVEDSVHRRFIFAVRGWLLLPAALTFALGKMRLPLFLTSAAGFSFAFRLTMIEDLR